MKLGIMFGVSVVGIVAGCGPVAVDLGGGKGGEPSGSGGTGVGGSDMSEAGQGAGGGRGGGVGVAGRASVGGTGGRAGGSCGDGVVDAYEECDDGNAVDGDGCTGECRYEFSTGGTGSSTGGTGGTGGGDEPDSVGGGPVGGRAGGDGSGGAPSVCGDGIVTPDERCDDGNREDDDGCPSDCGVDSGSGSGGAPAGSCWGERVHATSDCADVDVLLGQAHEACGRNNGGITAIEFDDQCNEYQSSSVQVTCCPLRGGSGGMAAGGGSSVGGSTALGGRASAVGGSGGMAIAGFAGEPG